MKNKETENNEPTQLEKLIEDQNKLNESIQESFGKPKLEEMNLNGHQVEIYDNGGETVDRYTVIIDDDFYGMSDNPHSPQGFNQYSGSFADGYKAGSHLGTKLSSVPPQIKKAIIQRMNESVDSVKKESKLAEGTLGDSPEFDRLLAEMNIRGMTDSSIRVRNFSVTDYLGSPIGYIYSGSLSEGRDFNGNFNMVCNPKQGSPEVFLAIPKSILKYKITGKKVWILLKSKINILFTIG